MSTPRLNLKRKVEIGLVSYIERLKVRNSPLSKYTGYEGSQADDRKLPSYIVEAMGSEEAFPGGPKNITVDILLVTQFDDSDDESLPSTPQRRKVREKHDAALLAIDILLDGIDAVDTIKAALNLGATKRPVSSFHFYDITKTGEAGEQQGRCFVDKLSFQVTCEPFDHAS